MDVLFSFFLNLQKLYASDDQEKKKKTLNLLDYCKRATFEPENYSLMICNGSLQTVKGSFDLDRIDVFLYLLDNYYKKKDELILSHCSYETIDKLIKYLDLFCCKDNPKNSVYNYCKEVYHISSKKLVDDIIKSGHISIKSPDWIVAYMKLAIRFWNIKASFYKKFGIEKSK